MKSSLLILVGPPGSGKTHFAVQFSKKHNFEHINSDQIRAKFFPHPTFTPEERSRVYQKLHQVIISKLAGGTNVIFDGNLVTNDDRRKALSHYLRSTQATILFVYLDTPKDLALQRATSRERTSDKLYKPMDVDRAQNMHHRFEPLDPALPQVKVGGLLDFDKQDRRVTKALRELEAQASTSPGVAPPQ